MTRVCNISITLALLIVLSVIPFSFAYSHENSHKTISCCKSNHWITCMGPYGGDRKHVIIDPHNPSILFVDSCDDSGVWISKTAGESTGDPFNPAWQHTRFDRGYTEIAGTYDESHTYILAVKTSGDNHVYILKYSEDENPQNKEWGKVAFTEGSNFRSTTIVSDPLRPGRVVVYTFDTTRNSFRIFESMCYGGEGSWKEVVIPPPPVSTGGWIAISTLSFDREENVLNMALTYIDKTNELRSILLSYDEEKGWKELSEEIDGLITSFVILSDKAYMTVSHSWNHLLMIGEKTDDGYMWVDKEMILTNGTVLPASCNARGLIVAPYDSNTIFVGITSCLDTNVSDYGIRGIYKSTDGGHTWRRVAKPDNRYMCYLKGNSIFFDPSNPRIMYAGMTNFDCIRKSTDYGETWYPVTEGLTGINVFGISICGKKVYAAVQSAIAINEDMLETGEWTYRQITDPYGKVTANLYGGIEADPFNTSIVLAGAGHRYPLLSHNGGIYRNINGGYSSSPLDWERVLYDSDPHDGKSSPQIMDIHFSESVPGLVLAAAISSGVLSDEEHGLYVSFDHGATWKWVYNKSDLYAIASDPFDSHLYYAVGAASRGGIVLKIEIDGENVRIEESRQFLLDDYFYSIDVQRGTSYEEALAFIGTENGKVISISLDALRELSPEGVENIYTFDHGRSAVVEIHPLHPEEVYVGLYGGGVYRSRDAGKTWENISEGLISSSINIFELKFSNDGRKLFAGTLGGVAVLKMEEKGMSIVKPQKNHLYICDRLISPFPFTVVIGGITVSVDVEGLSVSKVDFLVDGQVRYTDENPPYRWMWEEKMIGIHNLKAIAYAEDVPLYEDDVDVFVIMG